VLDDEPVHESEEVLAAFGGLQVGDAVELVGGDEDVAEGCEPAYLGDVEGDVDAAGEAREEGAGEAGEDAAEGAGVGGEGADCCCC